MCGAEIAGPVVRKWVAGRLREQVGSPQRRSHWEPRTPAKPRYGHYFGRALPDRGFSLLHDPGANPRTADAKSNTSVVNCRQLPLTGVWLAKIKTGSCPPL